MLLPSDIARLVLGYLQQEGLQATSQAFIQESPNLKEYVEHNTDDGVIPACVFSLFGKSLSNILNEYVAIKTKETNQEIPAMMTSLWKKLDFTLNQIKSLQNSPAVQQNQRVRTRNGIMNLRRQRALSPSPLATSRLLTIPAHPVHCVTTLAPSTPSLLGQSTPVCYTSLQTKPPALSQSQPLNQDHSHVVINLNRDSPLQVVVPDHRINSAPLSPGRRKCDSPRRRGGGVVGSAVATRTTGASALAVTETHTEPIQDVVGENFPQMVIESAREKILKDKSLQEKLAENINKILASDVSPQTSRQGVCSNMEPDQSIDEILGLQGEIHMTDDAIQDILEQTESDPAFQALFDLFDYSKDKNAEDPEDGGLCSSTQEHDEMDQNDDSFLMGSCDEESNPATQTAKTSRPRKTQEVKNKKARKSAHPHARTAQASNPTRLPGEAALPEGRTPKPTASPSDTVPNPQNLEPCRDASEAALLMEEEVSMETEQHPVASLHPSGACEDSGSKDVEGHPTGLPVEASVTEMSHQVPDEDPALDPGLQVVTGLCSPPVDPSKVVSLEIIISDEQDSSLCAAVSGSPDENRLPTIVLSSPTKPTVPLSMEETVQAVSVLQSCELGTMGDGAVQLMPETGFIQLVPPAGPGNYLIVTDPAAMGQSGVVLLPNPAPTQVLATPPRSRPLLDVTKAYSPGSTLLISSPVQPMLQSMMVPVSVVGQKSAANITIVSNQVLSLPVASVRNPVKSQNKPKLAPKNAADSAHVAPDVPARALMPPSNSPSTHRRILCFDTEACSSSVTSSSPGGAVVDNSPKGRPARVRSVQPAILRSSKAVRAEAVRAGEMEKHVIDPMVSEALLEPARPQTGEQKHPRSRTWGARKEMEPRTNVMANKENELEGGTPTGADPVPPASVPPIPAIPPKLPNKTSPLTKQAAEMLQDLKGNNPTSPCTPSRLRPREATPRRLALPATPDLPTCSPASEAGSESSINMAAQTLMILSRAARNSTPLKDSGQQQQDETSLANTPGAGKGKKRKQGEAHVSPAAKKELQLYGASASKKKAKKQKKLLDSFPDDLDVDKFLSSLHYDE